MASQSTVTLTTAQSPAKQRTSHAANVGVTAVLVLGMSIRFLHSRIDNLIDQVFFHKRHENEAAVHAFAEDAPYITDRAALRRSEGTAAILEAIERLGVRLDALNPGARLNASSSNALSAG